MFSSSSASVASTSQSSPPRSKERQMMSFEGLAAKPTTTKHDEAQNHQIHTSRLPRMTRNHMHTRLYPVWGSSQWELCKTTSCIVTSEAGELQGSCLTRRTAINVQTMISRTLCSSWLMNISWIFFSKTEV